MFMDRQKQARMDDGQKVITTAHPEHNSGEPRRVTRTQKKKKKKKSAEITMEITNWGAPKWVILLNNVLTNFE